MVTDAPFWAAVVARVNINAQSETTVTGITNCPLVELLHAGLPVFTPLSVMYTTLAKLASTKRLVMVPVAEPPAKAATGRLRRHNAAICLILFTVLTSFREITVAFRRCSGWPKQQELLARKTP